MRGIESETGRKDSDERLESFLATLLGSRLWRVNLTNCAIRCVFEIAGNGAADLRTSLLLHNYRYDIFVGLV